MDVWHSGLHQGINHTGSVSLCHGVELGGLINIEHIERNALETISQNLRLLNNGASSRHENQP